jgi:hypothetical protein
MASCIEQSLFMVALRLHLFSVKIGNYYMIVP